MSSPLALAQNALLARMQAQLDADKAAMAAKKAEQRVRMQETIKDNEAKIEAHKVAMAKAKAEDARIAEEYTRMLDEQDKRRQAALADLFSKTHLRAQVAGESAVRAAAEKERDELARIAELQAQRNAAEEAAAKAKTAAAKASAHAREVSAAQRNGDAEAEPRRTGKAGGARARSTPWKLRTALPGRWRATWSGKWRRRRARLRAARARCAAF
jgi:fused signal recognition particle receptor